MSTRVDRDDAIQKVRDHVYKTESDSALDTEQVRDYLTDNVAGSKVPRRVELVEDAGVSAADVDFTEI